ncbi:hypothetical protein MSAN_02422000 [Mycena sanguinolenta]|uniref:Uncharacterized protein n=1 Tax=Mycena sanguinolenta TaxID=230812 RepID=A0A8H6X340_9AGAR|nr:hypothetical protein MSAN_02422000 [Mycena sanguinolenta]
MSPNSNVKFTLAVDDFDSVITYANQSHWTTPDPSAAPDPALNIWFDATYHRTNVSGASFSFDFKGSQISLYGAAGPAFGSYEIDIDGWVETHSAHIAKNVSGYPLFSTDTLSYTDHTVKVTNLGAKHRGEGTDFLVDLIKTTVDIAPAGQVATLTNSTLEETDPRLVYTGNWTENVFNPKFSGNYSRYTNGDGASVSLNFTGTALFIFGDKTDRHGLYTVTLDNRAPQTFNGVSGCGGAFAHACEKDNTLAFFAANLNQGQHSVKVTNIPGELGAYFDLDAIVITTPSEYLPAHKGVARAIGRRSSMAGAAAHAPGVNHLQYGVLLLFLAGVLLLGRSLRR